MKPEVTPHQAAKILGCHKNTIYRWCRLALDPVDWSPLNGCVRRNATGHFWISRARLLELFPSVDKTGT